MNDIQKFLEQTTKIDHTDYGGYQRTRPWIVCKDGEGVSIQASRGSYCSPRIDGAENYYAIEAGFPSVVPPESWREYAEEWDNRPLIEELRIIWRSYFGKYRTAFSRKIAIRRIRNPMPTQTVYAWMPVETAQDFLDVHGGIDWDKTFGEINEAD